MAISKRLLQKKISAVEKQIAEISAIKPEEISNHTARAVVRFGKHTAGLIAFGKKAAYKELLNELK